MRFMRWSNHVAQQRSLTEKDAAKNSRPLTSAVKTSYENEFQHTEEARSFTGILKGMRVLVGDSVYEDAQVSVLDGILTVEFDAEDLDNIAVDLNKLGIQQWL